MQNVGLYVFRLQKLQTRIYERNEVTLTIQPIFRQDPR